MYRNLKKKVDSELTRNVIKKYPLLSVLVCNINTIIYTGMKYRLEIKSKFEQENIYSKGSLTQRMSHNHWGVSLYCIIESLYLRNCILGTNYSILVSGVVAKVTNTTPLWKKRYCRCYINKYHNIHRSEIHSTPSAYLIRPPPALLHPKRTIVIYTTYYC